jgi:hypothetical protein
MMKLTIEFHSEWWRVRAWWKRSLCRVFGHPGFQPRAEGLAVFVFWRDDRPICTRCGAPDPSLPAPEKPPTVTYTWTNDAFTFGPSGGSTEDET